MIVAEAGRRVPHGVVADEPVAPDLDGGQEGDDVLADELGQRRGARRGRELFLEEGHAPLQHQAEHLQGHAQGALLCG